MNINTTLLESITKVFVVPVVPVSSATFNNLTLPNEVADNNLAVAAGTPCSVNKVSYLIAVGEITSVYPFTFVNE